MIRNMGSFDRGVRAFVVTPVAIVLAFIVGASTVAGVILFVLAGIMLATSATGFCPNYVWLGISTYPSGLHRVGHHIRLPENRTISPAGASPVPASVSRDARRSSS